MRIVVAPDKFKGSLDAHSVARAIADGLSQVRPDVEIVECPLADGGEGTLDVLLSAWGGARRAVKVLDPLGRPIEATVGLVRDATTAVIELARISGYALLTDGERNPLRTSTFGLGQAIRAALESGVEDIVLALGGSATVDGGAGMMQALGLRLMGHDGMPLSDGIGGGELTNIARLDWSNPPDGLESARITIACDVLNPASGDGGAARVFARQKGADDAGIELLERGLEHWAMLLEHSTGKPLRNEPGTGAAGAVALPLLAFCEAELLPGVDIVFEAVRLADYVVGADLVITGEGKLDRQSMMGKVVGAVARLCRGPETPCVAIVGTVGDGKDEWSTLIDRVYALDAPMEQTRERLVETARLVATECL